MQSVDVSQHLTNINGEFTFVTEFQRLLQTLYPLITKFNVVTAYLLERYGAGIL